MDACSSLLAAPSYGLGATGAFDPCTPSPAPSDAARRALFSGWPNYPSASDHPAPMLGHHAPPSFSPYTPGSGGAPPYGSAFADIAAFGPQRGAPNLSAFYPSVDGPGDVYNAAAASAASAGSYAHPSQHRSQPPHPQQPGSVQRPASSAAVAAALHGSRLLLSDLQTAAAAVGAMPPPPPSALTNSRYDAVDPLCYLNDVVTGSSVHNAGIQHVEHLLYVCIHGGPESK